ncbi:MAG: hypothetical protein QOH47_2511 [Sphingomonadales bacterium]|nr:hypothetical protein [Sphingomonadales bacterium]
MECRDGEARSGIGDAGALPEASVARLVVRRRHAGAHGFGLANRTGSRGQRLGTPKCLDPDLEQYRTFPSHPCREVGNNRTRGPGASISRAGRWRGSPHPPSQAAAMRGSPVGGTQIRCRPSVGKPTALRAVGEDGRPPRGFDPTRLQPALYQACSPRSAEDDRARLSALPSANSTWSGSLQAPFLALRAPDAHDHDRQGPRS